MEKATQSSHGQNTKAQTDLQWMVDLQNTYNIMATTNQAQEMIDGTQENDGNS